MSYLSCRNNEQTHYEKPISDIIERDRWNWCVCRLTTYCHAYQTISYGYFMAIKLSKGKEAFNAEIENEDFEGNPTLTIDRMIEKGDSVAATGSGSVTKRGGERVQFKFSEMFTFSGDAISRLETYHIWLG